MSVIPAESLFCVKINNLTATLAKVDQFLTGVSPIGVSMMVPMQLAGLLGSPDANGINMSGNFAIFGPLPGGDKPSFSRIAVLVPVSDYDRFVKGNPKVTPPDAQGISGIGEAGQVQFLTAGDDGQHLTDQPLVLFGEGFQERQDLLAPFEQLPLARGTLVLSQVSQFHRGAVAALDPLA